MHSVKWETMECWGLVTKTMVENFQYFLGLKETIGPSQANKMTSSDLDFSGSLGVCGEGLHVGKDVEICRTGRGDAGIDPKVRNDHIQHL